jgi:hypothetical protein
MNSGLSNGAQVHGLAIVPGFPAKLLAATNQGVFSITQIGGPQPAN